MLVNENLAELRPRRRWWLRLLVVVALAAIGSLSRVPWYHKVGFATAMGLWLESFPRAGVRGDRFERTIHILFVPVRVTRWPLDRFTQIETGYEGYEQPDVTLTTVIFQIGLERLLIRRLSDHLLPWFDGAYKLYLRAASGQRVLAWQGNGERDFRANMATLQRRTGLTLG